jgi:hypothetical protein
MKVITYQAPNGSTVDISRRQIRQLTAAGKWPLNASGEYCSVSHGPHVGAPSHTTEELLALASEKEFHTYYYSVAAAIDDNTGTGDTGFLRCWSAQGAADHYAAELRGIDECAGEVVRTRPAEDSDATDYGEAVV